MNIGGIFPVDTQEDGTNTRAQNYLHFCVLFLTLTSIVLYTSSSDFKDDLTPQKRHRMPGFKLTELSVPSVKVYVHQALTLPRTSFQLPNFEDTINVEASRIVGIETETTLSWTRNAENALNALPSVNKYGLTGIYVSSIGDTTANRSGQAIADVGDYLFTGLLRLPIEVCSGQGYSWTCQPGAQEETYDNTYCVVVLQSKSLESLLSVAKEASSTQKVRLSDPTVKGAFCGNPLLQRIAAGGNAVYILNRRVGAEKPDDNYMLCKFNTETRELSQCFDIVTRNADATMPLCLVYVKHADTVVSLQYNGDYVLYAAAFDGQELDFKVLFRPLPSSSGFLIYTDVYEGNVIFHGDLSLYEVDTVLNLQSGTDVTMGIF
ncbi:serine threonine kinase, putative [Babesia ovis]|uniref:Serine threonine kinase, putative n=1 Tax=Babesia ovis TaxID=5869 RepID=A0A9W5TB18_BABOV|nr:serine threonine kinase, putative [Babesia ovis]